MESLTVTLPEDLNRCSWKFIPLIKAIRMVSGVGLKEAKPLADHGVQVGNFTVAVPEQQIQKKVYGVDDGLAEFRRIGCTYRWFNDGYPTPSLGAKLPTPVPAEVPMIAKDHLHEALVQLVRDKQYFKARDVLLVLLDM